MEKETSLSEHRQDRKHPNHKKPFNDEFTYPEEKLREAVKRDYKNVILAQEGNITWDEYYIRRYEIFGDKLI